MATVPPGALTGLDGIFGKAADWLSQPGNQNLLAGIGAKLDPEGVGGALGTATIGYNQSRVAAARAETQEKQRQEQWSVLKSILTPPGTPGTTKIEAKKDGNIVSQSDVGNILTAPNAASTVPAPAASTQAPGSGVLLPAGVPPVGTGTGAATSPVVMPTTTVTAQRDTAAAPATDPYARNIPQFDIRQIAPFLLSPGGSSGSLSGLTPEQINTIRGTENETERLRLSSVANIIQAEDVRSQIGYREASGQLSRAQADTLRAQQPYVAQKMLADIDQSNAAAEQSRFATKRGETLLPLEQRGKEADIRQSDAAAAASNWQVKRGQELLQFEKDRITADVNQSNAAAGASRASTARIEQLAPLERILLDRQTKEYVDLELNGQQFTAKGKDLMDEITKTRIAAVQRYKEHEVRKREAMKDAQTMREAATKAETTIKTRLLGGKTAIKDDRELGPDVDMFHATSKSPYVYILEQTPGVVGSTPKYKQRDLPTVDGHRYTAQEIYDAADARSMTVQEYMEQVFYPKLQQPVPWNTGDVSVIKPKVPTAGAPARTTD